MSADSFHHQVTKQLKQKGKVYDLMILLMLFRIQTQGKLLYLNLRAHLIFLNFLTTAQHI